MRWDEAALVSDNGLSGGNMQISGTRIKAGRHVWAANGGASVLFSSSIVLSITFMIRAISGVGCDLRAMHLILGGNRRFDKLLPWSGMRE